MTVVDGPVVVDASVVVDALAVRGAPGDAARRCLLAVGAIQAPQILHAEAAAAVRSKLLRSELGIPQASRALEALRGLRVGLHPFVPHLDRIWELRDNLTVYDAWYVAVAESLGTVLVTADDRLAAVPGPACAVRHVQDFVTLED